MAMVSQGFVTTVQLFASNGRTMNVTLNWDNTVTTAAEAETERAAWAVNYAFVGDGIIKGFNHAEKFYNDTATFPTSQDAEFGESAILTCQIADNPTKFTTLSIPMPKTSVVYVDTVGPNRDIVDIADAQVLAYIANWSTGAATISDGEKLEGTVLKGKRKGT